MQCRNHFSTSGPAPYASRGTSGGARANGAVANPLAAFFGATIPPDGIIPAELQERGRGLHGPVPYGPKGKQALLARKVHKHRRPELGHARRGTIKQQATGIFARRCERREETVCAGRPVLQRTPELQAANASLQWLALTKNGQIQATLSLVGATTNPMKLKISLNEFQ